MKEFCLPRAQYPVLNGLVDVTLRQVKLTFSCSQDHAAGLSSKDQEFDLTARAQKRLLIMRLHACRGGALVAIETGFMGPNYSVSTACATANYAFVAAANHIRKGEADIMLVGGSEAPIIPVGLGGFVACRQGPSHLHSINTCAWPSLSTGALYSLTACWLKCHVYRRALTEYYSVMAEGLSLVLHTGIGVPAELCAPWVLRSMNHKCTPERCLTLSLWSWLQHPGVHRLQHAQRICMLQMAV